MMQADRQVLPVQPPQGAEDQLRARPRVDEDERQPGTFDQPVEVLGRVEPDRAAPRHRMLRDQQPHVGLRTRRPLDQHRPLRIGREIAEQCPRIGDGRRQTRERRPWRQAPQPGQPQAQKCPALALRQRMQLVQDDPPDAAEEARRLGVGQQQRQQFRRGQQHLRRVPQLPLAPVLRRVAGADLVADGQPHLAHRQCQVAGDVVGERLQRRDVDRVQARPGRGPGQLDQARQEAAQRLAAAGGRYQQRIPVGASGLHHGRLMRPQPPAAPGEPVPEQNRQACGLVNARGDGRGCVA